MSFLLDTNVISESQRRRPDPRVADWLAKIPHESCYLSVLTVGEIEQGAARLGAGGARYLAWLEQVLLPAFADRILAADLPILRSLGRLSAEAIAIGRTPPIVDSLLAATAITHDLVLVTRNTADFASMRVETLDPWRG